MFKLIFLIIFRIEKEVIIFHLEVVMVDTVLQPNLMVDTVLNLNPMVDTVHQLNHTVLKLNRTVDLLMDLPLLSQLMLCFCLHHLVIT
jgi:hypothetical protein